MVATARICRSLNLYVYTMFLYEGLNKTNNGTNRFIACRQNLVFRPQASLPPIVLLQKKQMRIDWPRPPASATGPTCIISVGVHTNRLCAGPQMYENPRVFEGWLFGIWCLLGRPWGPLGAPGIPLGSPGSLLRSLGAPFGAPGGP